MGSNSHVRSRFQPLVILGWHLGPFPSRSNTWSPRQPSRFQATEASPFEEQIEGIIMKYRMTPFTRNPMLVPELYQSILDCFPWTTSHDTRPTLVALAQTCRALLEPTLDHLWRELHSLSPLIQCYTKVVVSYEDEDEYCGIEELDDMNPPTPAHWDVIKRYAHRVRELRLVSDSLSLRFLRSIGSGQSLLLPNLRSLFWHPREIQLGGSIQLIQPLLSATLVELHASLTKEDAGLWSFLQNYPLQCRNLKIVAFDFPDNELVPDTTTRDLSRSVCRHHKLTRLHVSAPIDDVALRQLSMSSTIKVLSIEHHPLKGNLRQYFRPEDIPFPRVEELKFITSNLDFITTFLRPQDQIFRAFRVDVHDRPTAKALLTFFSVMASRPDKDTLRALDFRFAQYVPADAEPPTPQELGVYCLSYQSFRPLMSFCCLRELVIHWRHQISLDDDELADMARSWPSLHYLELSCSRGVYPPLLTKYVTLQGLLRLVTLCPKLNIISLPIDARIVPMDTGLDVRVTKTLTLEFLESPISEARPVAEFLFRHFPSITIVFATFARREPSRIQDSYIEAYRERSERVNDYLGWFLRMSAGLSASHPDLDTAFVLSLVLTRIRSPLA